MTTPDGRLLALVWKTPGALRRAGRAGGDGRPLRWGTVEIFGSEELLARLATEAADLDAFLFEVELEDLRVRPGEVTPNASVRKF